MKETIVKNKSFVFGLNFEKNFKSICTDKKKYVLYKHLFRAGNAIRILFLKAEQAECKADFNFEMTNIQNQVDEFYCWLESLFQSQYLDENSYITLSKNLKAVKTEILALR